MKKQNTGLESGVKRNNMLVSELVKTLQDHQELWGDLEVKVYSYTLDKTSDIDSVFLDRAEEGNQYFTAIVHL